MGLKRLKTNAALLAMLLLLEIETSNPLFPLPNWSVPPAMAVTPV